MKHIVALRAYVSLYQTYSECNRIQWRAINHAIVERRSAIYITITITIPGAKWSLLVALGDLQPEKYDYHICKQTQYICIVQHYVWYFPQNSLGVLKCVTFSEMTEGLQSYTPNKKHLHHT